MADGPSKLTVMRHYRRLQQAELGRLIGVSESTISNWERRRVEPDFRDLVNLALVLNCELGDIVDDDRLEFRPRERGGNPAKPEDLRSRRLELPTRDWAEPPHQRMDRVSRAAQEWQRERERTGRIPE